MKQIKTNFGVKAMIGVFCLLPLTEGCIKEPQMFSLNQTTSVGPCNLKLLDINKTDVKLEITAKGGNFKHTKTVPYDIKVDAVEHFHCPFTIYKPTAAQPDAVGYVILEK